MSTAHHWRITAKQYPHPPSLAVCISFSIVEVTTSVIIIKFCNCFSHSNHEPFWIESACIE